VMGAEDRDPARAAFFEDSARNLLEPHKRGMRTIFVPTDCALASDGSEGAHIHFTAHDLTSFLHELREEVLCVNAGPAPDAPDTPQEKRTTATLLPGLATFEKAGAWEAIEPDTQPMRGIRIVDCGADGTPRGETFFDAKEGVDARLDSFIARDDAVIARLDHGEQIKAKLIVGADGRGSMVRQSAGIGLRSWKYGQKAIACHVETDQPHESISVEMHREGGLMMRRLLRR